MLKEDAPRLLDEALASPKWIPKVLAMSGNTDSYQPIEKKLKMARRCLEVLLKYRNPVAIVTKNHLITRGLDRQTSCGKGPRQCQYRAGHSRFER